MAQAVAQSPQGPGMLRQISGDAGSRTRVRKRFGTNHYACSHRSSCLALVRGGWQPSPARVDPDSRLPRDRLSRQASLIVAVILGYRRKLRSPSLPGFIQAARATALLSFAVAGLPVFTWPRAPRRAARTSTSSSKPFRPLVRVQASSVEPEEAIWGRFDHPSSHALAHARSQSEPDVSIRP